MLSTTGPRRHTRAPTHQYYANAYIIKVTNVRSGTASKTPKLYQPAPLPEPTRHAQDHTLNISQGTT